MSFPQQLKSARINLKLSQIEMALRCGHHSPQIISALERGIRDPTEKDIAGLIVALGVDEDFFYFPDQIDIKTRAWV